MSDLREKVFEYLEKDGLIHLSNVYKREKLYDEVISMVLDEAIEVASRLDYYCAEQHKIIEAIEALKADIEK